MQCRLHLLPNQLVQLRSLDESADAECRHPQYHQGRKDDQSYHTTPAGQPMERSLKPEEEQKENDEEWFQEVGEMLSVDVLDGVLDVGEHFEEDG